MGETFVIIFVLAWLFVGAMSTASAVNKLSIESELHVQGYELILGIIGGFVTAVVCAGNFWIGRTLERLFQKLQ